MAERLDALTAHDTDDDGLIGDGLLDGVERNETHTDPQTNRTYLLTERHQAQVVEAFTTAKEYDQSDDVVNANFNSLGIISGSSSTDDLVLTDASDDFDFVHINASALLQERFHFVALDGNSRTDTWLSNGAEVSNGVDPWDPDTDDDGLTDGQEIKWVTTFGGYSIQKDATLSVDSTAPLRNVNLTLADSDGDGYWDGWIGVYGVERSENVVLYRENLDGGIEGDEVVPEQAVIHTCSVTAPCATGVNVTGDATNEHSNVHLGELHWGEFDPSQEGDPSNSSITPTPTLEVEVDYIEGHNPFDITQNGDSVLEKTRQNYLLYGIDVDFGTSSEAEEIEKIDLLKICKFGNCDDPFQPYTASRITPDSLNAYELNRIREVYHDDTSKLHLVFANRYRDDLPKYLPHDAGIPTGVSGLTGTTGSPTQITLLERTNRVPYGVVILNESSSVQSFNETQAVLVHEMGHALGAGWLDDQLLEVGECYSGEDCVLGGQDQTPESIFPVADNPRWSVMSRGGILFGKGRVAFSIEEISTIDVEDIPSQGS